MAGIEDTLDHIEGELGEMRQRLTNCRKKGLDASVCTLKIMRIPSKIGYARATQDKKDMDIVVELFNDTKKELVELEKLLPKEED